MAIKLNEITTDITLEIDEDVISIADYKKASDNFLELVKEVSKQVSNAKMDDSAWQVKVYAGSIGLGVLPSHENHYADRTREVIVSGLKSLAEGIRPIEFSDKAIGCARSLASLFKKSGVLNPNVRIWSKNEESVHVDRGIAASADNLLAAAYEEDGAVDGILERVDGHGKLQIVIYDLIDERAVKCEILDPKLLNQALLNFQRRVEVIGSVKYRKDGMPVSIKVSKMINYPEKSEIPSILQMRSLLSGGATA